MTRKTRISNARIFTDEGIIEGDVLVHAGRIERISGGGESNDDASVVEADGRMLIPGMIDDQVHFREPGLTHKGEIATESRAAVAGGITSFMEMPNTKPPTLTLEALEEKYARAAEVSAANYAFYLGASNDNLDVIRALPPGQACGIKVFMGSSTGNMLVDDEATLNGIFSEARTVIATHCENTPRIERLTQEALARYGEDIPVSEHPNIRDVQSCLESSTIAVELARANDAHLHILHLTTAAEMDLFDPGPVEGKKITGEVCVHFLEFTSDDYERMGNRIKCNPSVKSPENREALIAALRDDKVDILATDHAPHTIEEKALTNYLKAPSGLPLVQEALLCALEQVNKGNLSLERVIALTSHNIAKRFGVVDRGFLREGYWADMVLVDSQKPTDVTAEKVLYKCGWSPFEGQRFSSSIAATWVNGELAWDGRQVHEHGAAQRMEFRAVRT